MDISVRWTEVLADAIAPVAGDDVGVLRRYDVPDILDYIVDHLLAAEGFEQERLPVLGNGSVARGQDDRLERPGGIVSFHVRPHRFSG